MKEWIVTGTNSNGRQTKVRVFASNAHDAQQQAREHGLVAVESTKEV